MNMKNKLFIVDIPRLLSRSVSIYKYIHFQKKKNGKNETTNLNQMLSFLF